MILVKERAPNAASLGAANGLSQSGMALAQAAASAFVRCVATPESQTEGRCSRSLLWCDVDAWCLVVIVRWQRCRSGTMGQGSTCGSWGSWGYRSWGYGPRRMSRGASRTRGSGWDGRWPLEGGREKRNRPA